VSRIKELTQDYKALTSCHSVRFSQSQLTFLFSLGIRSWFQWCCSLKDIIVSGLIVGTCVTAYNRGWWN